MQNTNTTLHQAAQLLQSYGWQAGKVEPLTEDSEWDWLESRERAYKLADYTDARAARLAAMEVARLAAHPPKKAKVKRMKRAQGMDSIFGQAA